MTPRAKPAPASSAAARNWEQLFSCVTAVLAPLGIDAEDLDLEPPRWFNAESDWFLLVSWGEEECVEALFRKGPSGNAGS